MHLDPYKVQLTQQVKPADPSQHHIYVEWVLEQQMVDGTCSNKIFLSDEAHFKIGGNVNKQNCRICSSGNFQVGEAIIIRKSHCLVRSLF